MLASQFLECLCSVQHWSRLQLQLRTVEGGPRLKPFDARNAVTFWARDRSGWPMTHFATIVRKLKRMLFAVSSASQSKNATQSARRAGGSIAIVQGSGPLCLTWKKTNSFLLLADPNLVVFGLSSQLTLLTLAAPLFGAGNGGVVASGPES